MFGEKNRDSIGKQMLKHYAKRKVKAAGKKILAAIIGKLMIFLLPILIVFISAAILIAAAYGGMPVDSALTGVVSTEEDEKIKEFYESLAETDWYANGRKPAWNAMDCWLVPGEGQWHDENQSLEQKIREWLKENDRDGMGFQTVNLHRMVDHNKLDEEYKLKWGTIYSVSLFYAHMYNKKLEELLEIEQPEYIAETLHPYFYYKKSKIITRTWTSSEDGGCEVETDVQNIYLLVESYTIYGHHLFEYDWVTTTTGDNEDGCNKVEVTSEMLVNTTQLLDHPNKRALDFLHTFYEFDDPEDTETAWLFVKEAGEAFTSKQERMEWLIRNYDLTQFASVAMIPANLMEIFKKVGEMFDIPWWFIAAISMTESSFDVRNENSSTGAYGLMQVMPANWSKYAPMLGFDPVADRDNPYAQVVVGTYLINQYIGGGSNINWEGDKWKEETLPGLTFYSGHRTDGVVDDDAIARCKKEYAEPKVWKYADMFRNTRVIWPVPGHYTITSPFDPNRIHPILKTRRPHNGIDIAAPLNAAVVSVSNGIVTFAGWEDPNDHGKGYGKYIVIEDGVHAYYYAHLNEMKVKVGDVVTAGDTIGAVGSTGLSSGPHLHFGVRNAGTGQWIDPRSILAQHNVVEGVSDEE